MNRTYNFADTEMFSTGRTHRQHFINNKAAFITLDPDFNDPFDADWLTSIEASEAYETAETRDDQLQQETQDVDTVMAGSRQCYNGMKYYIEKAFADKPKIRQKFGLDDYDDASQSQKKMAAFLLNLHTQSTVPANNTLLLAAGCTAPRIAEILTLKSQLSTEDTEQNVFITAEPLASKGRIKQYITSYGFNQKVNRASKVVFYNQPEELNLFLFPRHSEPAESFNVLGIVRSMANLPLRGVQVRIMAGAAMLPVVTTTDVNGEYGFAAIATGSYTLEFTKTGFTTQNIPVAVPASGQVTVDVTLN